ncbi:unnamed protein product [Closterium sp. NIES-53]
MASHSLVFGLPRVFPSLPPSLAPPCTPCIAGHLRATPHSSSLRPATAPFQTLHLDGTRVSLVRCLHSDRGGEFRSDVLAGFCGEQGIRQSWTLPESPQQNGVAEGRIGLVMDIAHTLWTGSPGAGSAFHVWGCLTLVRDTSADKLLARAIPCVFLGFPMGSPDYSFYHPPLHQFLDSRDIRFDESVSYYTWYPCPGLPVPPPPLFRAPSLPLAPALPSSSFSSSSFSAYVYFASTHRLDYATRVVAAPPPRPLSVRGESALGCDVLEDKQFKLEFLAAASPSLCAMLLSLEGDPNALDILTPCTYCTYVDTVPPSRVNIVDGMWLFKVKRPPGSPPVFKVRYVARGFRQREGVNFFQTIAPTPKMTTLRGRLHKEIWLRRPPGFTDTFPPGTQWSQRRRVYGLRQSPRQWHDAFRSTLRDLGFRPSSADLLVFVRTGSTPFFILVVAKYLATTSCMGLVLGGTQPVVLTGHCDSSYADDVETQRSIQGYCFCLCAGAVSWRSTQSSSVASSGAEAEIYAVAMAAQEFRWLTFLLADLDERPRSAPTLYSDNKAMILLCQEPRLESRVKHIDVRYFLLRELQRRGHARLDFVASDANTPDIFTNALAPGDHHRFYVQLGLFEVGPRLL